MQRKAVVEFTFAIATIVREINDDEDATVMIIKSADGLFHRWATGFLAGRRATAPLINNSKNKRFKLRLDLSC